MNIDLTSIGLTEEELQDRVVSAIANKLLTTVRFNMDPDIDPDKDSGYVENSLLKRKLDAEVMKRIDAAITELGNKHVLPLVTSVIEGRVLQQTNQWGEKKGEPMTFVEYLIDRADQYIREPVNYNGKSRAEDSYGNWTQKSTRVAWMIDNHLSLAIDKAMTSALKTANDSIIGGLKEAVNVALRSVVVTTKTEVKTP